MYHARTLDDLRAAMLRWQAFLTLAHFWLRACTSCRAYQPTRTAATATCTTGRQQVSSSSAQIVSTSSLMQLTRNNGTRASFE